MSLRRQRPHTLAAPVKQALLACVLLAASLGVSPATAQESSPGTSSWHTGSEHTSPLRAADCEADAMEKASNTKLTKDAPPQDLASLKSNPPYRDDAGPADAIRLASVRQSAISLGMRAGYNRGIWCYQREIDRVSTNLDRTFNFRALLFDAGGGFLYEPGIVTEDTDNRTIKDDGTRAASSSSRIVEAARERLASRPRDWRSYLLVEIEPLAPEHPANRPRSGDRDQWRAWVEEGWRRGLQQAADTVDDLWNTLERDYVGMVTYRRMLAEGKLRAPHTYVTNHGVTGNENELRIDDVEVQTTKRSGLENNPSRWRALPFAGPSGFPPPR